MSTHVFKSGILLTQDTLASVTAWLQGPHWTIACLCAEWCGTCNEFKAGFDTLAARHPDKRFIWIDIEDQADLVGDIDVDNFPTLLIQHDNTVAFFGTVLPDMQLSDRILQSQVEKTAAELAADAVSNDERRRWQTECNLRQRLPA